MASGTEEVTISVKTAKQKIDIKINGDATVKEVCYAFFYQTLSLLNCLNWLVSVRSLLVSCTVQDSRESTF